MNIIIIQHFTVALSLLIYKRPVPLPILLAHSATVCGLIWGLGWLGLLLRYVFLSRKLNSNILETKVSLLLHSYIIIRER